MLCQNQLSASFSDADYRACLLCPRRCGVDRFLAHGFCGAGTALRIARAALHHWEEPCLVGKGGSGAIFFSGCTLRCCFCQNYPISRENFGKDISVRQLADIFLRLEDEGAENIDLITPTHFLPGIVRALDLVKHRLHIPVMMNCGGYENAETIRRLSGYIDIYLPDLKYKDAALSKKYSAAADYFETAVPAIQEMISQTGVSDLNVPAPGTALKRGVIIRHLVLPSCRKDSIALMQEMARCFPAHKWLLSLMSQYTPFGKASAFPEISRRLTSFEYDSVLKEALRLGLRGYMQEKSSAREEYTPPFDLEGVP